MLIFRPRNIKKEKIYIQLMKLVKVAIIICASVFLNSAFAQERGIPVYQDYLTDNLYLIHPSMAGASSQNKVRLTGRQQWFDVDNPPSLQTLSVNGRMSDQVGLGGILFNDSNGNFTQQGMYLTFAYHLMFSRSTADLNMLSFGASVGLVQNGLDESSLIGIGQPSDPIISGANQSTTNFNFDFGFSYFYLDFFVHGTIKNIVPQENTIFTERFEVNNQRQYLLTTGYNFNRVGSDFSFEPSVMYQRREATNQNNIDVNGKVYYELQSGNMVWGGLSYRRSLDGAEFLNASNQGTTSQRLSTISPFVGINHGQFMFAYMYTNAAFQEITLASSGFHQITIGYNFGESRKRYKCNCPAVNF